MATENKTLWPWLAKARDACGPRLHIRRIENVVSAGDPDVDGVLDGRDFAIELKVAKRPARASTGIRFGEPLKPAQLQFIRDRIKAGGACGILVQIGEHPEASRYLVPGNYAEKLAVEHPPESWYTPFLVRSPGETVLRATELRNKELKR